MLNFENNTSINSVTQELHMHNEINTNKFDNTKSMPTDFKNNIIYQN